ncbi:MAG: HD domain-containing protein, partial [Noviherbaspirillum sp.]
MVSIAATQSATHVRLSAGLTAEDSTRVMDALAFVEPFYRDTSVVTGQNAFDFAQGVATTLAWLNTDADTRIAGLLFDLPVIDAKAAEGIETRFGKDIADLVRGIRQLMRLHVQTFGQHEIARGKYTSQQASEQLETLRKMLLAMATDMRVVLVRLASRVTTLRYFAELKLENDKTHEYARETLDLYAPLANRLGVWQLKWELEDLAFRFLEPAVYKRIAKMLEEKRIERESFVEAAIVRLKAELAGAGIKADVFGRPKHIYSIWNKMRGKSLDFSELYDVRAFRVIVDDVKTCYAVLGLV